MNSRIFSKFLFHHHLSSLSVVTSISMLILTYLLLTNFLASLIICISHSTSTFHFTMMVTPLICSSHDPALLLSHTFLTMNPTSPITNLSHSNIYIIIIIIILTSIFFQEHSRVWTEQHKVDNQPLAFSFMAVVYPWEYWNKVMVIGCSSWHQPTRIREETLESGNLFSSSWILPPYRQKKSVLLPLPSLPRSSFHLLRIEIGRVNLLATAVIAANLAYF